MQKTYGDNTRSSSNSLFALGLRVVASPHASASSSVLFQVGVEFWNIIGTYIPAIVWAQLDIHIDSSGGIMDLHLPIPIGICAKLKKKNTAWKN